MRRVVLPVIIAVALAFGAGAWVLMPPVESPGPPPAPSRRVLSAAPPSLSLLGDLGLPDAEQHALKVLEQGAHDLLIVYPKDVDPIATAARWSLAITGAGLRKTHDESRAGRTVLRFADQDTSVLLAVGRTTEGPFVLFSHPAVGGHWADKPDTEAPAALRALLPRPEPAASDL